MLKPTLPLSLVYLSTLVFTSACLQQSDPKMNNNNQKTGIVGTVMIRDFKGVGLKAPEASIMAQFASKSGQLPQIRSAIANPEIGVSLSSGHALESTPSSMKCSLDRQPKSPKATQSPVSVGKLVYGLLSAQTFTQLEEDKNHLYKAAMTPGFTAGAYAVQASGSANSSQFGAKMNVPDSLSHVVVAGQDMEVSATAFRKTDALQLSWEAPTTTSDLNLNQIEVEIMADTDSETMSLYCDVAEKDLINGSTTLNLEIPAKELKPLNATPKGFILVKRAQLVKAADASIGEILFAGIRTVVTQALIAE